eukprot:COSAG03_NODE_18939_length_345_cov_1.032520_1_plen_63_part_01
MTVVLVLCGPIMDLKQGQAPMHTAGLQRRTGLTAMNYARISTHRLRGGLFIRFDTASFNSSGV